jgi:protein TonB
VNLRYPIVAIQNGVSGIIYVYFVVDKGGKRAIMWLNNRLDLAWISQAVRVLKMQTFNWLPGIQNSKSIDVEVVCPIQFKLQ